MRASQPFFLYNSTYDCAIDHDKFAIEGSQVRMYRSLEKRSMNSRFYKLKWLGDQRRALAKEPLEAGREDINGNTFYYFEVLYSSIKAVMVNS